jgi:hypothetical protein
MQALSLRTVFETSVIKMNTAFECRSVRPEQLVAGLNRPSALSEALTEHYRRTYPEVLEPPRR